MKPIYSYQDYREYLKDEFASARFGRGGRSELARKLDMETSLLSRILAGKSDFTPEHGFKVTEFFKLGEPERKHFLLLLSFARAGTHELKMHYQHQIEKVKDGQDKIKSKIPTRVDFSEADLIAYYGSWHHLVVQMAVRNPELRTVEAISKHLRITPKDVRESLNVLEKLGFVRKTNHEWRATESRVHIAKYPAAIRANHMNLRNMAIRSYDESSPKDLHYSLILSADKESVEKIREMILSLIKNTEPVIEKAKDEQVLALSLDFFKVGGID